MSRNDFIVDSAPDTMKFKNGLYTFSDSGHAWHWSAKRAFDDNANTYWHTPYTFGNYKMKRSKNYTRFNYVQAEGFRVITLKLFDTYGETDIRPKLINLLKK